MPAHDRPAVRPPKSIGGIPMPSTATRRRHPRLYCIKKRKTWMLGTRLGMTSQRLRPLVAGTLICALALAASAATAGAQTYGFATLQPGTLNHTTASAIAKVLKEKAGLNVLVQPTAGDQVIVPMIARDEAEIGISNAMEVHDGLAKGFKDLRIIAAAHALRVGFFVRKDGDIRTVADLKGKRVPYGFSAMRALEPTVRAILATAGLTEKDIKPVLVPNVIRSADDFVSGAADAFYFAFGAPKVREVDATVGGIRMTEIHEQGMPSGRKIERWGYLTEVNPMPTRYLIAACAGATALAFASVSHDQLRHLQGAEGKGGNQHTSPGHSWGIRNDRHRRARRGRFRHGQRAGTRHCARQ